VPKDFTKKACGRGFLSSRCNSSQKNFPLYLRFAILTVVKVSIVVFWAVPPCSFVGGYQHLGGTYHLHFRGWTSVPKMAAVRYSETLTNYNTTRCHNPEDQICSSLAQIHGVWKKGCWGEYFVQREEVTGWKKCIMRSFTKYSVISVIKSRGIWRGGHVAW
jgi:hypothetical protein